MPRITVLFAVVILASLSACGSRDEARYPAAHPKGTPTVGKEDYLRVARSLAYTESRPTDQELAALPPKWCHGLAQGHDVEYLFSFTGDDLYPAGQDWGMVEADANDLLTTGVNVYCPQYWKQVKQDLQANGGF
ncbi:hypothetical protein [Streptomyces sviceus]|uniref:hypothetical protein n=1 Tax=Streptomyces sviceus TaxID=285530 RepID=UPI0036ECD8EE